MEQGKRRPSMLTFLVVQPYNIPKQQDAMTTHIREYQALEHDMPKNMPKDMPKNKATKQQQNFDLIYKVRRFIIPVYNGSARSIARSCVNMLYTYFLLNPMTNHETIKFSMLHLNGKCCEWWYHVLMTLGHASITCYIDFTQRWMYRFEIGEFIGSIYYKVLEDGNHGDRYF